MKFPCVTYTTVISVESWSIELRAYKADVAIDMIKFKSGIFPSLEILSPKDNEILTLLLLLLISVGYKSSNKQSSSHNRGYNKPNYSWMHCRHLDCLFVKKAAKNWVPKRNPSHPSSVNYLGKGELGGAAKRRGKYPPTTSHRH